MSFAVGILKEPSKFLQPASSAKLIRNIEGKRAASGRIFPFRFCGQPVVPTRQGIESAQKLVHLIPTHIFHWAPVTIFERTWRGLHHNFPLLLSDFKPADNK